MLVEYTRMAAVVVNRDVIVVLLEDHACMGSVAATREVRQTAAKSCRLRRVLLIMPSGAILEPEIERPNAGDKPFEVRCSGRKCSIHTAAGLPGGNIAVEHDFAAADRAVLDIDVDASAALYIERHRILGSGIRLGTEAFQRHRAAIGLNRLAVLRACDIDFRHAGNIRRTARRHNAPGRLQRSDRSRIVHEEFQRLRLDVKCFSGISDGSALRDARDPAAILDRQDAICCIDVNILIRYNCAAEPTLVVLIRDGRVLREAICAVCLTNIRIDVFLILIHTAETRRELRRRLLRARRGRRGRRIAALPCCVVKRDVFDTLAGSGSRQAFGDLRLARKISLSRRIGRVPELPQASCPLPTLPLCSGRCCPSSA